MMTSIQTDTSEHIAFAEQVCRAMLDSMMQSFPQRASLDAQRVFASAPLTFAESADTPADNGIRVPPGLARLREEAELQSYVTALAAWLERENIISRVNGKGLVTRQGLDLLGLGFLKSMPG